MQVFSSRLFRIMWASCTMSVELPWGPSWDRGPLIVQMPGSLRDGLIFRVSVTRAPVQRLSLRPRFAAGNEVGNSRQGPVPLAGAAGVGQVPGIVSAVGRVLPVAIATRAG